MQNQPSRSTAPIHAKDLISGAIKLPDAELEHLAEIYQLSAGLRSRISFAEFAANPDDFIEALKNWANTEWTVDFTTVGDHERMWVNEASSKRTLQVAVVRENDNQIISAQLYAAVEKHGYPDAIAIPALLSFNIAAARAWCRINEIPTRTLKEKCDRAQVIDAGGREAA